MRDNKLNISTIVQKYIEQNNKCIGNFKKFRRSTIYQHLKKITKG